MKTCSSCKENKALKDFYKKGKRCQHYCKKCFNEYCKERWNKRKIEAIVYKGSKCENCGLKYPDIDSCVFDFHHKKPNEKEFDWRKLRIRSWNSIVLELNKCSLLCSNCHRLAHKTGATGFEPASSNYALID